MALVTPHGSPTLITLLLEGDALAKAQQHAKTLTQINITSREVGDLIMLGIGGFTPLTGFMGEKDWKGVVTNMHLDNGLFWPIPITLSTDTATANTLQVGQEVALADTATGEVMGILTLTEKYGIDKDLECCEVFGTTDIEHPGVKMVMNQGAINLAGSVQVLSQGEFPTKYAGIYMTPAETRKLFEDKGWQTIAAFQTRNQCTVHMNTWQKLRLKSVMAY
jgi:sulfate adenylyltransferase